MHPKARVELARQAYARAVELARSKSTPRSWGRLLTAGRNLRDALQRSRGMTSPAARRPEEAGQAREALAAPALTPAAPRRAPDLAAELERARALQERARRLVSEARGLTLSIAAFLAARHPRRVEPGALTPEP
jgi:hypothetical protein